MDIDTTPQAAPAVSEEAQRALYAALAKAQGAMAHASKDRENPHFKQTYATLASVIEAVRGPLSANGIARIQIPAIDGRRVSVTTRLVHAGGGSVECTLSAMAAQEGAQAAGGVITYLRRYGLLSVCGIAPDDDDAEEDASARRQPERREERRREPEPDAAEVVPGSHHPTWDRDRPRFCAVLGELGLRYEDVADYTAAHGKTGQRPSAMTTQGRDRLLDGLRAGGAAKVAAWVAERAVAPVVAEREPGEEG